MFKPSKIRSAKIDDNLLKYTVMDLGILLTALPLTLARTVLIFLKLSKNRSGKIDDIYLLKYTVMYLGIVRPLTVFYFFETVKKLIR